MIKTVQIRIIAPDSRTAQLAIAALQNSVGSARVALTTPRQGRKGDEWLTYGTFQVDDQTTLSIEGSARKPRAVTVPTTKQKPATGKTTKLKEHPAPKARNVVTPDDIGSQGVFIRYDDHADRYYAEGVIGPLARCIGTPYVLKSDAVKQARTWIDRNQRTGYRPENWPGAWKPAPNQPKLQPKKKLATKTKRLRGTR